MLQGTQPPRIDRDALSEDESGELVTRLGTVVAGGLFVALAASVPAEMRIGDGGSLSRALDQWLALAAVAMPIAIALVGVLRRARAGVRILVGDHTLVLAVSAIGWAVVEVGFLSVLGAVLRAKTHHHGLAGVTFALVALVSGLLTGLLAVRGGRLLANASETIRRGVLYVAAAMAFVIVMLVGVRTAGAEGMQTASALVDVLGLVIAASIASARPFTRARALAIAGVPLAVLVVALGLGALHAQPALHDAVVAQAPVQGWILGLFSSR
jgi:hypothetical protein